VTRWITLGACVLAVLAGGLVMSRLMKRLEGSSGGGINAGPGRVPDGSRSKARRDAITAKGSLAARRFGLVGVAVVLLMGFGYVMMYPYGTGPWLPLMIVIAVLAGMAWSGLRGRSR
jgi:hypothetical protein